MFYTIYKITNMINGKIYIGLHKTKKLNDGYMGSGKMISYAIKKHGLENFKKEILFTFDNEKDMINKEIELVTEEFCLRKDTYNLAKGGGDGWSYFNANITEEQKKNRAIAGRKMADKNTIEKYGSIDHIKLKWIEAGQKAFQDKYPNGTFGFTGKKHNSETKSKMSNSMKEKSAGSNNSQYGSMWITNGTSSVKIKKDDLIPDGWKKGRKMK